MKVAIFESPEDKGLAGTAHRGGIFCEADVTSDDSVDAGVAAERGVLGQEGVLVKCADVGNAIRTTSRPTYDSSIQHFSLDAFEWAFRMAPR